MSSERILFVTGRLAERSVRRVVADLAGDVGFEYDVAVLGISVAALMNTGWVARKLAVDGPFDRVILPGWCQGTLSELAQTLGLPVERGPKDCFDLPAYFGRGSRERPELTEYSIEILAEINHATRLSDEQFLAQADHYRASGANIIDVGTVPGESSPRVDEIVKLLTSAGHRVSIDSFDRVEVESAVAAGAELVLSCNSTNIDWASSLGVELVAIPDRPDNLDSLQATIDRLQAEGVKFRIDPILEPIGYGFAASLARYYEARRRWPDLEIMMGIGNITELTEVDTAGVNMLLAAICEELRIRSVLATEVINWARSAVAEFDIARRLARHAVAEHVLPKHVDSRLVMLRDPRINELTTDEIGDLAAQLTDPNFRIFVENGVLHLLNRDGHWQGSDPYEIFDRMLAVCPHVDASHAFYLGYEMSKAMTARTLGKQYRQDEALQWGFLTVAEVSAVERRHHNRHYDGRPHDG